ncbi:hypothetical protein, partial [Escherichia coli]|uniref:hypothetical protein n=1 Tax=Escherichia coli TaxID=562 RepID=UPI001BC83600
INTVDIYSSYPVHQKQKPAEAGFYVNQVKLTDKPLSFGYSVVDPKAKTRRSGFLRKSGETDR